MKRKSKKNTRAKPRKRLTPKNLDPYSIRKDDLTKMPDEEMELEDDPNEDNE